MITLPRTFAAPIAVALHVPVAAVASAQEAATPDTGSPTAELAKKCLTLVIKAHPVQRAGSDRSGYAQAQRLYFHDCVAKNGNMSN
jgi:hypothetical protein